MYKSYAGTDNYPMRRCASVATPHFEKGRTCSTQQTCVRLTCNNIWDRISFSSNFILSEMSFYTAILTHCESE